MAAGADMILTHHPMIFSGIKKINNHTFTGRKILRLIREDIPYFAMHTNYDVIGMADLSADYLKLQDTKVLTVTDESGEQPEGFGRVGKLPRAMTLGEFGKYVKNAIAFQMCGFTAIWIRGSRLWQSVQEAERA